MTNAPPCWAPQHDRTFRAQWQNSVLGAKCCGAATKLAGVHLIPPVPLCSTVRCAATQLQTRHSTALSRPSVACLLIRSDGQAVDKLAAHARPPRSALRRPGPGGEALGLHRLCISAARRAGGASKATALRPGVQGLPPPKRRWQLAAAQTPALPRIHSIRLPLVYKSRLHLSPTAFIPSSAGATATSQARGRAGRASGPSGRA